MELLRDLERNTVDFVPTYDQSNMEPVVLPARYPNLLVNGSSGIAVGMATNIPPHNLGEVCDAVICLIDNPNATLDEIQEHLPAPDFPTGGVICGRVGTRQGYLTGRSTITLRARTHFETEKNSDVIVVTEIPFMETRDRIREKLEHLVRDERIKGISRIVDLTDRNIPTWQVRLHIVLKKDADKEIVLNQLFQFSPLQSTVSMILLALVGNRPQVMSLKDMLQEFILHRVDVIRRRTEFLLSEARKRKHTVEGLMIAQIDIDQVINTIRSSSSRNEAKDRLREIDVPAELIARALGADGFRAYQDEQGTQENYHLSANQAEAIVSMQLGALANLEREKLSEEHKKLLEDIAEHVLLLSDEANIRAVVRTDMEEIRDKFSDKRRTEISDDELTDVDRGDLITEEPMVVTLSQRGYIKRTPLSVYQAQNRGGKGIKGAKSDDEDPIEHLFVASTHAFLLFFTSNGKVHWQKVYDLPLQNRTAKGRAIVNVLAVDESTSIHNCLPVMEFDDERFLIMATRKGIVKKTALAAYSRPQKGGIIAINLDDDDELIDVRIVSPGDDVVIGTRNGMSIRFSHEDARPMGRNTRGVKGIALSPDDVVVGMVVTRADATLLSLCENGYGKRTPFGTIAGDEPEEPVEETAENEISGDVEEGDEDTRSNMRYRRQRRGGKGLRDIRTTSRNGKVVDILSVLDDDDILMVTAKGKIQRIHAADISVIGRNTQGVRVIRLDDDDKLVSTATIPAEILEDAELDLDIPVSEVPNNGNGNGSPAAEEPPKSIEPPDDDAGNEAGDDAKID
jgi:DNA gyrase subunit A